MSVISVKNVTKDFGHGRGVFDVSIEVKKGEVYGFLGPNGAGKSTTIRQIMGFTKPQNGSIYVNGKDAWKESAVIKKNLGYLPGEIALPENLNGTEFIKMMAKLRKIKDMEHTNYLIKRFDLDPSVDLKRISLGMKRKLAVVTAFMHDPDILILDEPTSGLDPITQKVFIDYILEEKKKGKTILLSSHLFNEIDTTCDTITIIKEGHLMSTFVANDLKHTDEKTYLVGFDLAIEQKRFEQNVSTIPEIEVEAIQPNEIKLVVNEKDINTLIQFISTFEISSFKEIKFSLEEYFMHFYDRNIENLKEGD